jgi:hypothetical protein
MISIRIRLHRQQQVFVSGFAGAPSHLPLHLYVISQQKSEKIHLRVEISAI